MAGTLMTLVVSFLLAAVLWLILGSRFRFATERAENALLNLAAYFGLSLIHISEPTRLLSL